MEETIIENQVEEKNPNVPYYIYLIIHPLTDEPVYVGQAVDVMKRLGSHLSKDNLGNWELDHFFKYLGDLYLFPKFKVLEKCTAYNVNARERYWVQHYAAIHPGLLNIIFNPNKSSKYKFDTTKTEV